MLEILAAGFKETGISMFLGSAIVGAVIGWGFKRFNLIYLAIHQVCYVLYLCNSVAIMLDVLVPRLIKHPSGMGVKLLLKCYMHTISNKCLPWLVVIFPQF